MRGSIQPAEIDHQDQQAKRLLELELTPEQMDGTAPLSPGQRAKLLEDSSPYMEHRTPSTVTTPFALRS